MQPNFDHPLTTFPVMSAQNGSLPPSQISIIDFFFPGFSRTAAVIQRLVAGKLNNYARLLCALGVLVFGGKYAYRHLEQLVNNHFCS
jgi:mitochondrial chaperone BCS1